MEVSILQRLRMVSSRRNTQIIDCRSIYGGNRELIDFTERQKSSFEDAIKILDDVLSKEIYELEYKSVNNQLYIEINFNNVNDLNRI